MTIEHEFVSWLAAVAFLVVLGGAAYLRSQWARLRRERDEAVRTAAGLREELAGARAESRVRQDAAEEKIRLLQEAEERLSRHFENIANRLFEEKRRVFQEESTTGINGLLAPMRRQLDEFRRKVEEVHVAESRERASLRTEIHLLKSLNERIGAEAMNLARALKGDSKVRGAWGEMQLERLLEESGLVKGREFELQKSFATGDGRRSQPDVIVHLPDNKDVVIDAKVSLVDYERYHAAGAEEERRQHLRRHIAALRSHFRGLGAKNYDELTGLNSLDMVIMFVPIEPALLLALEHEPGLFNEAYRLGVLLVCPSTLMATLQIIHNIWRYEHQNRNALQIATEAGKLHDQFVLFAEALEKIGEQLAKARETYDTARKRLIDGRGNLVRRTLRLRELGAKTKKTLPASLAGAAEADENGSPAPAPTSPQTTRGEKR